MDEQPDSLSPDDREKKAFRRRAALAVAQGYIARHGSLGSDEERAAIARMIWFQADAIVNAEDAPAPEPEAPSTRPLGRPVHPSDEWGVIDGNRRKRGFITREEAEEYAESRPDAQVVQISGPEIERLVAAPAGVD